MDFLEVSGIFYLGHLIRECQDVFSSDSFILSDFFFFHGELSYTWKDSDCRQMSSDLENRQTAQNRKKHHARILVQWAK